MQDEIEIKVVAHVHPFLPSARIERTYPFGTTIQQIIESMSITGVGRPVVMVDGELVQDYGTVPAPGALVTIRVVPAGQGGTEADRSAGVGMKVAGAAVMVVGALVGLVPGAQGVAGFLMFAGWGMIVGGIATYGGAISDIFGKSDSVASSSAAETLPSIRGGRNRASPWGKIPAIFGKHLVTPLYGAQPYTSIATDITPGDTIYLHQLFVVGLGPLKLSNFKIGETLLASNSAATRNGAVSTDDGSFGGTGKVDLQVYQDGTNPSLYPEMVLEDNPSFELKNVNDPNIQWRATPPNVTKASVDITLPRGLYKYGESGKIEDHAVTVEVRRRVFGSGTAWASATLVNTFTLSTNTNKTLRYTFSETLAAGQYEYSMHRTTADDAEDLRGTSVVQWSAMRSIRAGVPAIDASVRSRYVIVALKIKASEQLQGVVDQLNCIAEAEVPIYSGSGSGAASWAGTGFSRNPAALFLAAMRGNSNPRAVPSSSIDWARLESWYTLCASKNWFGDFVFSSGTRLRDMLNSIAQTGRGSFTFRDGLYSAVVDEPKTTPVQHFSPRNVRGFAWTKSFEDKPHALKVNFISADDGYAAAERIVLDDGYIFDTANDGNLRDWNGTIRTVGGSYALATNFRQVTFPGVTSAELALKQGRYLLAVAKLRPEVYTFETDIESIICEPGDLVRMAHDAIAISTASGRIKNVTMSGATAIGIAIDEAVTFEDGKTYAVRIRRSSDGLSVYAAVNNAAGYYGSDLTFTVAIAAGSVPAIGDLFTFGEATIETAPALVVGYEMLDELNMKLYLTDAADGVHTADSGTIPAYVSRVSRAPAVGVSTAPPTVATVAVVKVVANAQEARDTQDATAGVTVTVVEIITPRYWGRYEDSAPTENIVGDVYTRFSETSGSTNRGVFRWDGTDWVRTEDRRYIMQALQDVAFLIAYKDTAGVAIYGDSTDYTSDTVTQADFAFFQFAFIGFLEANNIKVRESLRGGDRYDETGATIDGNKPGFFFSGLTGGCKVAGIEFEGSQGGGVQWGAIAKIGTATAKPSSTTDVVACVDNNTVVVGTTQDQYLKIYLWDGEQFLTFAGFSLLVSGLQNPAICSLGKNKFVLYNYNTDSLQVYQIVSNVISTVGSAYPVSIGTSVALCEVSSSQFMLAYIDGGVLYTEVFSFDGTDIEYVAGNSIISGALYVGGLAQLSADKFAINYYLTGVGAYIQTLFFDGASISTDGNDYLYDIATAKSITALNGTDLVVGNQVDGGIDVIRYDGTDWSLIPRARNFNFEADIFKVAAINGTDVCVVSEDFIYCGRFGFALSTPYSSF